MPYRFRALGKMLLVKSTVALRLAFIKYLILLKMCVCRSVGMSGDGLPFSNSTNWFIDYQLENENPHVQASDGSG